MFDDDFTSWADDDGLDDRWGAMSECLELAKASLDGGDFDGGLSIIDEALDHERAEEDVDELLVTAFLLLRAGYLAQAPAPRLDEVIETCQLVKCWC